MVAKFYLNLKNQISLNLVNSFGWTTPRKIVVFESDDWGTIRMSSQNAFNAFLKKGIPVNECAYNSNDTLENNDDLERLFEALTAFKDKNNQHPKITANNIVANPNFEKIKESNFKQYHYEVFTETLKKYPNHDNVYSLYKQGIERKIFHPQFHGREHLNVANWLKSLKEKNGISMFAFNYNMFSSFKGQDSNCKNEFLDGFGTYSQNQLTDLETIIKEGTAIFENLWGYQSKSIIAPCYIWHPDAEKLFLSQGIEHIQTGRIQKIPLVEGLKKYRIKRKFTGQKNALGQIYTIRNTSFEPSTNLHKDWVDSCLSEIRTAFLWKKPAIISTHRLNFVGGLNEKNIDRNLPLFKTLLKKILHNWPDTEFLSSDQLGTIIKE